MNILFLSLSSLTSLSQRGIYTDLIRKLLAEGHTVTAVHPSSDHLEKHHIYSVEGNFRRLSVHTGQITKKKNLIQKGISTLLVEHHYKSALRQYCKDSSFDLVLSVTPPISFGGVVKYIKKTYGSKSYLMLKDIFPQNAIDIGLLPTWGPWKLLLWWFKRQERQLYRLSDYIGCMSPQNVSYLLEHTKSIPQHSVEVCPNSIDPIPKELITQHRKKEGEPLVFLYGGNLGKPQDIPYLIACLKENINKPDRRFIICGTGTESDSLQSFLKENTADNITYIPGLPVDEYEALVSTCDVGMIFLDHRFTIPNFPSRILSYMEKAMPVLACTDKNTDMGTIITEGNFGWWCESKNASDFTSLVDTICTLDQTTLLQYGENARLYLENNYTVDHTYQIIMNHFT